MYTLRLLDEGGSVIREYESDRIWIVSVLDGHSNGLCCSSGRWRVYPSAGVTVEVELAEMVPAG